MVPAEDITFPSVEEIPELTVYFHTGPGLHWKSLLLGTAFLGIFYDNFYSMLEKNRRN